MGRSSKAVHIGNTPYGKGVFAGHSFRAGEVIGRVRGEILDDPDYGSDYCMALDGGRSLEPTAPFRYLNHSCEANCELVFCDVEDKDGNPRDPEMWVEALRAIEPGEELTIDYSWPAEEAIPCGCGRAGCRGWIVAADEVHLVGCRERLSSAGA